MHYAQCMHIRQIDSYAPRRVPGVGGISGQAEFGRLDIADRHPRRQNVSLHRIVACGSRVISLNLVAQVRVRSRYAVPYFALGSMWVFSKNSFQVATTTQSAAIEPAMRHCASYGEPPARSATLC